MAKEEGLPEGFTCECGGHHRFPAYVYAHWDTRLIHTCDVCDRQHAIIRGTVSLIEPRRRAALPSEVQ